MAWAKGKSGNPAGRPKGSGKLTSVLRERLDEVQPDGRTLAQHITDALVTKALEGDTAALRMLYDRSEGPVNAMVDEGDETPSYLVGFYLPHNDRDPINPDSLVPDPDYPRPPDKIATYRGELPKMYHPDNSTDDI